MSRWLLVGVSAFALAAATADAKPRVRFGGVFVGAGYAYGGFPYFAPYYYDPFYYGFAPIYPGYFNGFAYAPNMGEVKLEAAGKDGEVFLNGAFAGETAKLKSMWLDPGVYNLEIKRSGHQVYERRIYVLTGKTLRIRPDK